MPDELSVRQWQELYRAGAFEKDNEQTRELAGWGEVDDPLNNWRMKKLSRLVLAVTHPFILDNYRVFFSVGQPNVGHKYGFVCFYPDTTLKSPEREVLRIKVPSRVFLQDTGVICPEFSTM